ncbi:hypothetical protein [Corynebacterium pygosceleis]|uniref:hypothetical protein n=1 Tax=Corynebacterium pygosceleis TaxID=2800406 RepID=UPI0019045D30|nr:hypothetical protein [Corynebacterium pygosceleis]MCL0120139.1 hypothetical protein [Corynebacterium pygosceleis]
MHEFLGLDKKRPARGAWGGGKSNRKVIALSVATACVTFLIFSWLLSDMSIGPNLTVLIIATLSALNLAQVLTNTGEGR